ncbi:MAG: hypothetical protein MZU95_15605 [Desulfomicrobium escambiense]|nr:hypothetical protein [Desulfomicrobium escambiense]
MTSYPGSPTPEIADAIAGHPGGPAALLLRVLGEREGGHRGGLRRGAQRPPVASSSSRAWG